MVGTRRALLPLTLALLVLTGFAVATHLPDHRYYVQGNIVDSVGRPGMFLRVGLVDISDPLMPASAGFGGDDPVLIYLHSNNVGDQIHVTVGGGQSVVITAEFDPADGTTARFSPRLPFTISPGANLVPYILIALAIVIPLWLVMRRYAPVG